MKFAYKFSNLLGTIYHKGNLLFSPDGYSVISPVGNRITIYDLKKLGGCTSEWSLPSEWSVHWIDKDRQYVLNSNKSFTLPVESKFNYNAIDLSPNGTTLIAINEEGDAHIISMISKMIIHTYRFKKRVRCVKFSPDGKHFAVCKENNVFIFNAPGLQSGNYNPFVMERIFHGASDETTCLQWSYDSKLLAVGSKDKTTKLYSLEKFQNFPNNYTFGSHSDVIVACFFEKNSYDMSTLSRNGHLIVWECCLNPEEFVPYVPGLKKKKMKSDSDSEDDVDLNKAIEKNEKASSDNDSKENGEEEDSKVKKLHYKKLSRHYLADEVRKENREATLTAAAYHEDRHILVVGFSTGAFYLYEMPDVNMIHSLSISNQTISSITLNNTGDWIALGCSSLGQLLVWEWQSETYAMKQQGHSNNMTCLAYSPDGQYIVTGGEDSKVKLWSTSSSFSTVTFHEHTSSITGVVFSHNRKFVLSSSLDGTVRAYDLTRYRNFKTFTGPRPVQFCCVALDSGDEFAAAGGQDVFEIYLWSMKLGTLVEVMSGHEGPVVSLAFNPSPASSAMASTSWDKTVKLWNAIESSSSHETIQLTADGLYVTYRPDGEEIAVATLDGQISFFDSKTSAQTGSIEGRKDLGSGRSETDMITAKKSLAGKAFSALCYSADGSCILAGGQSKHVCIYNVRESVLLKKFEITQNRSFDAVDDFINRRKMTEFGNMALVEEREETEGGNIKLRLPGVRKGDMAARSFKPEIRVFSLEFSPTGQSWAAATTEGLLIYSLDIGLVFDPFQLDMGITPSTVKLALEEKEYSRAIMMALKLNEKHLIRQVVENVPYKDVALTAINLPQIYVEKLLHFIGSELENTIHLHFYLIWIENILNEHGSKMNVSLQMPVLLLLQKNMQKKYDDISKICDFNEYTAKYIQSVGKFNDVKLKKQTDTMGSEEDNDSDINEVETMDED